MARTTSIEIEKLARGAFAAVQLVPAQGYRWIAREGQRWLMEGEPVWLPGQEYEFGQPALRKRYKEDPGLHQHFAALEETEEGIQRFANQYGRLWGPMGLLGSVGEIGLRALKPRESFDEWCDQIRAMARLLRLWNLIQESDLRALGQSTEWRRDPTRVYVEGELFASEGLPLRCTPAKKKRGLVAVREGEEPTRPKLIESIKYGDVVTPARMYVVTQVNERLSGHVSPAVTPFVGASAGGEILFYPDSLLSALYVLFALQITDYGYDRCCLRCHSPFRTTNPRKTYCSEECKKADWEAGGRRKRRPSNKPHSSPTADADIRHGSRQRRESSESSSVADEREDNPR